MTGGNTQVRAACVQLSSGRKPAVNLEVARKFVREAASKGARLVTTPEMSNIIEPDYERLVAEVGTEAADPFVTGFSEMARDLQIWLLLGSAALRQGDRLVNRSILFNPKGEAAARYDKIHMFDVDLPNGERYRESRRFAAGSQLSMAATPWGILGLTVCYDMRFPHLYRALAERGAQMISVPSAFTRPTGEAHWEILLRARAIETGSFIIAAAQCGEHESGRKTWGHSLIADSWGSIAGISGEEPGVLIADIDLSQVEQSRSRIPALKHGRPFALADNLQREAS